VDLSLGPNKQIRIHAVEGHGLPHFTEICNSAFKWLDCCNSFFWDTGRLLMTDYLHPGKTTVGQYCAEPTFKLLAVVKQKH